MPKKAAGETADPSGYRGTENDSLALKTVPEEATGGQDSRKEL